MQVRSRSRLRLTPHHHSIVSSILVLLSVSPSGFCGAESNVRLSNTAYPLSHEDPKSLLLRDRFEQANSTDTINSYKQQAKRLQDSGDIKSAIEIYNKAIQINPKDYSLWSARALAKGAAKDLQGALSDLNMALKLQPKSAKVISNRGVVYGALGNPDKALRDFGMAVELDPKFAIGWKNLGIIKETFGDITGACKSWKVSSQLGDKDALRWLNEQCI